MKKANYIDTACSYTEGDVREFCECNEREYTEEGRYAVESEMRDIDYEDFVGCLKASEAGSLPCVVTGALGLWWGRPSVEPSFGTLAECVLRCAGTGDNFRVDGTRGGLSVRVTHHDGVNSFLVRILSPKGEARRDEYLHGSGRAFNVNDYHNYANKRVDWLF